MRVFVSASALQNFIAPLFVSHSKIKKRQKSVSVRASLEEKEKSELAFTNTIIYLTHE